MSEIHEYIYQTLSFSLKPLCAEEMREHDSRLREYGVNNICTRLSDPELKGRVWGAYRKEKHYKEWWWKPITEEQKQEWLKMQGRLL